MKLVNTKLRLSLVVLVCVVLAACGGGSGGGNAASGNSNNQPDPDPVVIPEPVTEFSVQVSKIQLTRVSREDAVEVDVANLNSGIKIYTE